MRNLKSIDDLEAAINKILNIISFDIIHFDTISLAYYRHLTGSIPCIPS